MDFWPWLIGLIVAVGAYTLWSIWKVHSHPAQILLRQAASMNWVVAGEVKKNGYRLVRLTREDEEAVISYKTCDVLLFRPHLPLTFGDFIELERWLALEEERAEEEEDEDEQLKGFRLYFREFERIIALHGYFEELISAQGTDEQFSIASMKLQRAGFFARKTPDTVAALVIKALAQYDKNRKGSLEFLTKHEKDYQLEAARHGDASGEYNYASKPKKDVVTPQDDADLAHCRLLAEQGNSTAQSMLGVFYACGDGVPQNYAEALKWLRLAADQGDANAQGFLASMYAGGQGVPQNDAEALKWYRLAADQGNDHAQLMLGMIYGSGKGVTQNGAEALKWYRLAADQGNDHAQKAYEAASQTRRRDYVEASQRRRLAADQSNASAPLARGGMNYLRRDYAEAAKYFRLAADRGSVQGLRMLGVMHENGQGLPQDDAEAVRYFRLAADRGDVGAQLALGLMHADGRGVVQDYIQAYKWCTLSVTPGYEIAVEYLDNFSSRMTPNQIAEAQELAREWKPTK